MYLYKQIVTLCSISLLILQATQTHAMFDKEKYKYGAITLGAVGIATFFYQLGKNVNGRELEKTKTTLDIYKTANLRMQADLLKIDEAAEKANLNTWNKYSDITEKNGSRVNAIKDLFKQKNKFEEMKNALSARD